MATTDAPRFASGDDPTPVRLTVEDVNAATSKAAAAHAALVAMWTDEFRRLGQHFDAPRIASYRGSARSACGVLPPENAVYCDRNNTIYFDDLFLAAEQKYTGESLGSDGDMAAVGIIAHEMGHAVTLQLGVRFKTPYLAEAAADCLAGAFAQHAERDGSLEPGDLDEAFFAMGSAADPNRRMPDAPRRRFSFAKRIQRTAHGTQDQRQGNFRAGYEGGGGACVPQLR